MQPEAAEIGAKRCHGCRVCRKVWSVHWWKISEWTWYCQHDKDQMAQRIISANSKDRRRTSALGRETIAGMFRTLRRTCSNNVQSVEVKSCKESCHMCKGAVLCYNTQKGSP
jgi:hypothetical protein